MQYSVVNYKNLNVEMRLDAEYYKKEIMSIINDEDSSKFKSLDQIAKFIIGPFGSTVTKDKYVDSSDYLYVRNKNINDFIIGDEDISRIPRYLYEALPQFHIEENDLLITVVGTLGKVAIARKKDTKSIFSCKSTIIRNSNINVYYLLAYLNSNIGQKLILRGRRGAIQEGLNLQDLKEIMIYIPKKNLEEHIENIIKKSFDLGQYSKELSAKCENLLLKELGLIDYKSKQTLSCIKNFSDVKVVDRFDAEYFQPKYEQVESLIRNYKKGYTTLEGQFHLYKNNNINYKNEGSVKVIKTKQIQGNNINYKVNSFINENNTLLLSEGDILFASMGVGSLGKSAIFRRMDQGKYTVDSTIRVLRRKSSGIIKHEVLQIYLQLDCIRELIYRDVVGSTGIINIYDDRLKNLCIPLIDDAAQENISNLVNKSYLVNEISKKLLIISKISVEIAIEQDEDVAIKWIESEIEKLGVDLYGE